MRALLAMAALCLLAGCSSLLSAVVKAPQVRGERLEVSSLGVQTVDLSLKLDVENPNSYDLPLENLRAEILVKDKTLLSRHWEKLPTLTAKKTTGVELPLQVAWADLLDLGLNLLRDKDVPYRIKGTLLVKGVEVPFDESGTLQLRR